MHGARSNSPPDKGSQRRIAAIQRINGELIVGTTGGTWKIINDRPHLLKLTDAIIGKTTYQNGLWAASIYGINRLTSEGLKLVYSSTEIGINSLITQLLWVNDNELWVTTQSDGLKILYIDENRKIARVESYFDQVFFTGITVDDAGAVWVSSLNNGVFKFQPWFRAFRGIRTILDTSLQQVVFADALPSGDGAIVASRFNSTFVRTDEQSPWISLQHENTEYATWLNGQEIFFSTGSGFNIFDALERRVVKSYSGTEFPTNIQPPVKQVDTRGNALALAAPNGTFLFKRENNELVLHIPGRATSVAFAGGNRLLLGQPNNLQLVDIDTKGVVNRWSLTVNDIVSVDSSRFIISTAINGLILLDTDIMEMKQLSTTDVNRNQSWTVARSLGNNLFGVAGSMGAFLLDLNEHLKEGSGAVFYDIPLRPFGLGQTVRDFRLVNGNIWISTGNGVLEVPFNTIVTMNLQPNLQISRLFADEQEITHNTSAALSSRVNQLRIELSNTGYQNNDRYLLQFRQNSGQDGWIELNQPTVLLAQLPPGFSRYEFRFIDLLTGRGISEAYLDIDRTPFWWQSTSGMLTIAFGFILFGITISYVIQQRIQKRKVEAFERADKMRKLERVAVTQLLTSHYVFNALTTIRALMRKSSDEAINYIGKFAQVIRVLVDQSFEIDVDLESELRWIDDYLSLEATNRGIELNYTIHCDEGIKLSEVAIPSFTLQPIYENALTYGKGVDGKISIDCKIVRNNDVIILEVANSFNGLSAESNHQDSVSVQKGSVGLKLMHDRLANWVAFHNLSVSKDLVGSRQNNGVWITVLRIPYIPYE